MYKKMIVLMGVLLLLITPTRVHTEENQESNAILIALRMYANVALDIQRIKAGIKSLKPREDIYLPEVFVVELEKKQSRWSAVSLKDDLEKLFEEHRRFCSDMIWIDKNREFFKPVH